MDDYLFTQLLSESQSSGSKSPVPQSISSNCQQPCLLVLPCQLNPDPVSLACTSPAPVNHSICWPFVNGFWVPWSPTMSLSLGPLLMAYKLLVSTPMASPLAVHWWLLSPLVPWWWFSRFSCYFPSLLLTHLQFPYHLNFSVPGPSSLSSSSPGPLSSASGPSDFLVPWSHASEEPVQIFFFFL